MTFVPFKNYLLRESHTRNLNILRGDVPEVKTVAILTGWNPMGQRVSAQENNNRNKRLVSRLRESHFRSFKVESLIYGQYGNLEQGYLIPHITKELTIKLTSEFCQKAAIFGTRKGRGEDSYMEFEWLETSAEECDAATPESYSTTQTRRVVLAGEEAQSRTDYYSAAPYPKSLTDKRQKHAPVKPRKFFIPFFDDTYANAQYADGKRRVATNPIAGTLGQEEPQQFKKAESYEPDMDIDENISFVSSELPGTDKVKYLVEEIKKCERGIYDSSKTEQYQWICRGNLHRLMRDLATEIAEG